MVNDRASSHRNGCEPTRPKWEVVTEQLATRFRERTAVEVEDKNYRQKTDLAKNLPVAEYAVFVQKYSIQEWSDLEIKVLFQNVAAVKLERVSSRTHFRGKPLCWRW